MKLRAQLQRWPPLVLLQSWEQVPKRRHSLMSGGYTGEGGHGESGYLPAPSESRLPTLASRLARHGVEARATGTVGGFLRAHAAGLIPADAGVGGAAGQLGVCGGQSGSPALSHPVPRQRFSAQPPQGGPPPTPAGAGRGLTDAAVFLIGAIPAVIQHVAAKRGGQAALVPAQKLLLVFAVGGLGRGGL